MLVGHMGSVRVRRCVSPEGCQGLHVKFVGALWFRLEDVGGMVGDESMDVFLTRDFPNVGSVRVAEWGVSWTNLLPRHIDVVGMAA